ncbi:MAG TPA: hypothetical protein DDX40_06330 [Rikenellaceae bacterium]|nr:hypothetical protein [Rikenellaceae bacterium]
MRFVIRPLNAAGHITAQPMHGMIREDWSFIYLISGEVLTDVDGNPHLLRGQDCALIPPQLAYSVKYFKDCIGYMGAFPAGLLRNSGHKVLRLKTSSVMTIPLEDKVFFDELMIRMSRFPDDPPMLQGLLEVMLCQFDSVIPQYDATASSRLCSSYLSSVFDTSRQFTGVAGYARELGVTPNHLNRVVKSETGRSAGEWIENARLSLARTLLHDPGIPISEVSYRVGFEDPAYFSRFFKKLVGMSPTDFRSETMNK